MGQPVIPFPFLSSVLMSEPEVESIDKMCTSQEVHCSSIHNSQDMETH